MSFWGRTWFMIAFCVLTGVIHAHFLNEKKRAIHQLNERLNVMENEKMAALKIREDYQLRIASQSDPAWIEMILMRDLGVVPEGFLKVHFKK